MSISTIFLILAILYFSILPSLKDRIIPVRKLLFMPAVFIFLLSQTIKENFSLSVNNVMVLSLGLFVGVCIGIVLRLRTPVKVDKQSAQIWLPGSYVSLFIFISIFMIHFAMDYLQTDSAALLFFLSVVSFISIGMSSCLFYRYQYAKLEYQLQP